jgi:hypothetical protein
MAGASVCADRSDGDRRASATTHSPSKTAAEPAVDDVSKLKMRT